MHVELVSPERVLFSGEADMVICRTSDGDIAFLANHAPLIGALGIGLVRIVVPDGPEVRAAVHGGFVEVRDNHVIILSDVAELEGEIDVDRARRALDAAEREESDEARDAARRASVRLELARAA